MPKLVARLSSILQRMALLIRRWPVGWIAILIAGEIVLAQRQLYGAMGFDESYFVFEGWAVNHGLVPYRDFTEFKPPVLFWMNGLALRLFGVARGHYRWMFVLLLVVSTTLLLLVLCRRGATRSAAFLAAAAIAYALLAPHLHDSGLDDAETIGIELFVFALAALLWNGRGLEITTALGGALLALVVLSKEPYAPAVLATWATLGFVARADRVLSWPRYAKLTILGAAAVVVPVVLDLALQGAIPFYVRQIRVYFGYVREIGCVHPHSLGELFSQAWPRLTDRLLLRDMYESSVPLMVAFAILPGWGFAVRIGTVLAVLGGLYAVTVGGCYWGHYFVMGMAGLSLWIVLGALELGRRLAGASGDIRRWVGWALIAGVVVHMGNTVGMTAHALPVPHPPELATSVSPAVLSFVKRNTTSRDYVLTDGGPELYVLADRRPATREVCFLDELIDVNAGRTDEERLAGVRQELRKHPPKLVYLSPESAARKERTRHALIEPFLQAEKYRSVTPELYVHP